MEGTKFPDFEVKDLADKPLSIANYKGKVVLLDFWATWCPPCRAELPNVIKTYEAHHKDGFEIIGISLDQDREKLTAFIKEKNMTWPQYFDGKGSQNKLAVKYGVLGIPATYLLDGQGNIIGKELKRRRPRRRGRQGAGKEVTRSGVASARLSVFFATKQPKGWTPNALTRGQQAMPPLGTLQAPVGTRHFFAAS